MTIRMLGWIAVASMLAIVVLGAGANRISAASVTPIPLTGAHPTCAALAATYGGGQTWLELKLEGTDLANGTHTFGSLTITITNLTDTSFDWSSNFGVDAVLVKAGEQAHNLYVYAPTAASAESFGDTGLHSQDVPGNGISHISFCYDLDQASPSVPVTSPSVPVTSPSVPVTSPSVPVTSPSVPGTSPSVPASGEVEEETGTPGVTPPSTSTDIGSTGSTSNGWLIPILGIALLLASLLLLTPSRTVRRRR
jgi:hypothetical protein